MTICSDIRLISDPYKVTGMLQERNVPELHGFLVYICQAISKAFV